jgi:hypothetical protein
MSRFPLAAGILAAVLATGHAQPPAVTPTYTAFPDLRTPLVPTNVGEGKVAPWPEYAVLHARLVAAAARQQSPDAAPAVKVRCFQLKAGAEFLRLTHVRRMIGFNTSSNSLAEVTAMVNDVYRVAADAEPDAAGRRTMTEERVRVLKELERQTEDSVPNILPPADLDFIRFHRLRAEAELLALAGGKWQCPVPPAPPRCSPRPRSPPTPRPSRTPPRRRTPRSRI